MAFNPESLQRARALMDPNVQEKMNSYKGQAISSYSVDGPTETYMTEGQLYEAGYDMSQFKGVSQGGPRSINESGLPDIIKRSFMENEINVDCLNPDYAREKKFEAAMTAMMNEAEQNKSQCNVINENIYPTNTSGIDYNILRQIIEESIDKKLKYLNESVVKGIRLKEGKIMLTDHSGNVFSATLEYKGNVNEQKNKKKG
jgi:hypothetical protein